jgi:hypothetical protein
MDNQSAIATLETRQFQDMYRTKHAKARKEYGTESPGLRTQLIHDASVWIPQQGRWQVIQYFGQS